MNLKGPQRLCNQLRNANPENKKGERADG